MGSLFPICNAYHLGAYQVAINEAADLDSTETNALSSSDAIEKDCYVYRSYIALGSYQVRLKLCFLSLRSRLSTRDDEEKFVSSRSSRCEAAVATVWDDDDFRSVFARAVFERINGRLGKEISLSVLSRMSNSSLLLSHSLSLGDANDDKTMPLLRFVCL